jgi:hypothetical protein
MIYIYNIKPGFMRFILSTILIILYFSGIKAQDSVNAKESIPDKILGDAAIFGKDALGFFTAPARFSAAEWAYTAGTAGSIYLLMSVDPAAKREFSKSTASTLNKDFWDVPTYYGYIAPANVISLSVYAAGLFSGNDEIRKTGRLAFEAISISGISVMAVRYVFGRSRPVANDFRKFNWLETRNDIQSFPSGHTVVAFAMSTVFAEQIDNIWARIGFYGMAALTGCARIRNNQHWLSDVVTGAALGLGAGFYVLNREKERENPGASSTSGVSVFPSFNSVNLRVEF